MWLWLGIGSIAAYVLMRSKEKRWTRSGEPQRGHFRGVDVRYDLDQIKLKSTVLTRVGVPLPSGVEFTIAREGLIARLLRRLGIGREVDTGLSGFDFEFEIQSEYPQVGAWLGQSPSVRKVIKALFDKGIGSLSANSGQLYLDMVVPVADAYDPRAQSELAVMLTAIAESGVPAGESRVSVWQRAWPPMLWAYAWAIIAALMYLSSAYHNFPALIDAQDWRWHATLVAMAIAPVILWLAACWMRDSILARIVLVEFAIVGTAGFVFGAPLVAERANIELASGSSHAVQVAVRSLYRERQRKHTDFYLILEPFLPGETMPVRVEVDRSTHVAIEAVANPIVSFEWRTGALGQPIVVAKPVLVE
jgi:hypothetical protein